MNPRQKKEKKTHMDAITQSEKQVATTKKNKKRIFIFISTSIFVHLPSPSPMQIPQDIKKTHTLPSLN